MSAPPPLLPPATLEQEDRWFRQELHPHLGALRSYLRSSFPTVHDVDDLVQESFLRVWKARAISPIRSARAFLFGVARRLAVDVIRSDRSALHEPMLEQHALVALAEARGVRETVINDHELELLMAAIDTLPSRCREIVVLRKLDGLSHREIASRLGISEETVQVQIGRGMDKVARFLRRHGVRRDAQGKGGRT